MSIRGVGMDAGAARESESLCQVELVKGEKIQVAMGGEQMSCQTFRRGSRAMRGRAGRGEGCAAAPSVNYYPAGRRGWWSHQRCV